MLAESDALFKLTCVYHMVRKIFHSHRDIFLMMSATIKKASSRVRVIAARVIDRGRTHEITVQIQVFGRTRSERAPSHPRRSKGSPLEVRASSL